VLTLLTPFYMNGMHHFPLDEAASGMHTPENLWPRLEREEPLAWFFIIGLFAAVLAPLFGFWSCVIAARWLRRDWRLVSAFQRAILVAALIASIAITALALSPFGRALSNWALD
jgi:hypothetical protein